MITVIKKMMTMIEGQSVVEYAVLFVIVALVLIFAIMGVNFNSPVSSGLNAAFTHLIDDVSSSLNKLTD